MKILSNGDVLFEGVKALYPRINRTYKFDSVDNKTVPCDAMDDGAAYETSFELTKAEAIEMHKQCMAVFKEAASADTKRKWKDKPQYLPYREPAEEGQPFVGKAKLKGAYGNEKTKPPVQKDAEKNALPDGFQLTSGSTVNVWGKLFAYNTGAVSGVSLRLKGVQVLELLEREGGDDPFSATTGFSAAKAPSEVSYASGAPIPKREETLSKSASDFDDEIPF